jgi:hypothetical protein
MTKPEINYTNTIPEIRRAYALFRRKYTLRRMMPMTLLLLISFFLGINLILTSINNNESLNLPGLIITALSAGMLVSMWLRPRTAQKKLIATIEQMGEERYIARFYDDRIEIDTEIIEGEETEIVAISKDGVTVVENPEAIEEAEAQIAAQTIQAETSIIRLGAETLYSVEDSELFCLFVNRALIYIFPKRCMNEEQISELQNYFKDKAI